MLALAGGLLYAARERIREVGRKWLRSGSSGSSRSASLGSSGVQVLPISRQLLP